MTILTDYQTKPILGSIREGFGLGLRQAAEMNPAVMGLCADLTESIRMNLLADAYPDRFIQVGVAEQNLVGVAAGLAMAGKIPVAGSYAVFSPGRSWDQLRVSVCYSNLNVKIVGGHSGVTVGPDGATHQALEDLAITRVLPNLTVIVPCDELEAQKATLAMIKHVGPVYLRSGRDTSLTLTTSDTPFEIGKALTFKTGDDVSIIACGIMVAEALAAAHQLETRGIAARVINLHTIKPLDTDTIVAAARETGAVVTAEEHQIVGGMGSAVAEILALHQPVPIEMVGMHDSFGESGQPRELLEKYHMTSQDIFQAVMKVMKRKQRD